jgi:hypothetical protein
MNFMRLLQLVSLITLGCTLTTGIRLGFVEEANASNSQPLTHSPSTFQITSKPSTCPQKGGGGPAIALYTTENFYIYICQGGTGRTDWRELDYYGVNRNRPNESLRLRAIIGQIGYYAVNGPTRYNINGSFLSVTQNGKTLLKERVLRCEGNPTACEPDEERS